MRHKWSKRTWWKRVGETLGLGSTQTCARCGAQLRVVKPMKLLPGRRRPSRSIARSYRTAGELMFWQIGTIPQCLRHYARG